MSETKRLVKNTFIIAIGSVSTKLITFFMLPFYTSHLTTADYGLYDYIYQISLFIIPLVTMLMDESVFRFLIDCKNNFEKKEVVSNAVFLELIGTILFIFLAYGLGKYFNISYINYAVAYILSVVASSVINPILRGQGKYVMFTVFNSSISFFLTIFSIVFIKFLDMGAEGLLLANTISHFMMCIIFSFIVRIWKYLDFSIINKYRCLEMIRFSFPLIPNRLSWMFIGIANRMIIMNFLGASVAGIFGVAYKFPLLVSTLYGFFGISWQETAARALHNDESEKFYNSIYEKMNMLLVAIVMGAIAFLPLLFYFLVDERFYVAIEYVPFMIIATYFGSLATFLGGILTAYKDTKAMGVSIVVSLIINLLFACLTIGKLESYSVLVALIISNFVLYILRIRDVSKYVSISIDTRIWYQAFICISVVYVLFNQNNFWCDVLNGCITSIYGIYVLYVTGILESIKQKIYLKFV